MIDRPNLILLSGELFGCLLPDGRNAAEEHHYKGAGYVMD